MHNKKVSSLPLVNPSPDFETLVRVLRGECEAQRIHFTELLIDEEVVKYVTEQMMGKKWTPRDETDDLTYWKQIAWFYYRMGYDYVPVQPLEELENLPSSEKKTDDTAVLNRGKRVWAEQGRGIIKSWKDFELFPWEQVKLNVEVYEQLGEWLPEGMKIVFFEARGLFEYVLENILGYEGLFYLLYDQPDLVETVFSRWGKIIEDIYRAIIPIDSVGAIFHGDDLAYYSSTLVNPEILRKMVFPWFRRYASFTHKHGKMYWYHCCGNVRDIIEDLIEYVRIDAFHSFQDVIIPVTDFQKTYGHRIAVLGGVDMDNLCRLDERELREYVRAILKTCMDKGRYALGSGNSIANYVPINNYLAMLEEGLNW